MTKTELWTWEAKDAANEADLSGFDVEATRRPHRQGRRSHLRHGR